MTTTTAPIRVLLPLPALGYEATEAGVPWKVMTDAGIEVVIATPDGKPATADITTATGEGLGWLGPFFRAAKVSRNAWEAFTASEAYRAPIAFDAIDIDAFDAVCIPGGHHHAMIPYLENERLQARIADFYAAGKLVAAICHGVLMAARCRRPDGRSILAGHTVTVVPGHVEPLIQRLCAKKMGDPRFGYLYDLTAEEEVRELMAGEGELVVKRMPLLKDAPGKEHRGLVFVDGNVLTGRMPHDTWTFAKTLVEQLEARASIAVEVEAAAA